MTYGCLLTSLNTLNAKSTHMVHMQTRPAIPLLVQMYHFGQPDKERNLYEKRYKCTFVAKRSQRVKLNILCYVDDMH